MEDLTMRWAKCHTALEMIRTTVDVVNKESFKERFDNTIILKVLLESVEDSLKRVGI